MPALRIVRMPDDNKYTCEQAWTEGMRMLLRRSFPLVRLGSLQENRTPTIFFWQVAYNFALRAERWQSGRMYLTRNQA